MEHIQGSNWPTFLPDDRYISVLWRCLSMACMTNYWSAEGISVLLQWYILQLNLNKAYDTHNTNLLHFWCYKFAMILPSICCNAFSMVPCTLPAVFITNLQMLQFYHSTTLFITWFFVWFCVATGLTAVCFTICMIQHIFSILIYLFNHIFIKLPWIEDKQ